MYIKRIKTDLVNHIFLNKAFEKYHLDKQKLVFSFGAMKQEVTTVIVPDLADNVIAIPEQFLKQLTIPEHIEFDWYLTDKQLVIGPFIGIIRYENESKITSRSLNFLERWLKNYKEIKGLIYVIPLSEIEEGKSTINGFYYNSNAKKKNSWTKGTFPFPTAAFHRPFLKMSRKYQLLKNKIGDNCFNMDEPGKWEFYNWMTKSPSTKGLVPYTDKLVNYEQVEQMLKEYQVIYLKKRYGGQGKGILQVRKNNNHFEVNEKENKEVFMTLELLLKYLAMKVGKKKYIIQQGVPFFVKDEQQIDFRVYLQKDSSKKWRFKGIIARIAKSGQVITNIKYTEQILSGKDAFMNYYGYDEKKTGETLKKIEKACLLVGNSLDEHGGHYGDIALDLIVDGKTNQIYFLEMNCKYGHKSFSKIKDSHLREDVLKGPMLYAKALSGFQGKEYNKKNE